MGAGDECGPVGCRAPSDKQAPVRSALGAGSVRRRVGRVGGCSPLRQPDRSSVRSPTGGRRPPDGPAMVAMSAMSATCDAPVFRGNHRRRRRIRAVRATVRRCHASNDVCAPADRLADPSAAHAPHVSHVSELQRAGRISEAWAPARRMRLPRRDDGRVRAWVVACIDAWYPWRISARRGEARPPEPAVRGIGIAPGRWADWPAPTATGDRAAVRGVEDGCVPLTMSDPGVNRSDGEAARTSLRRCHPCPRPRRDFRRRRGSGRRRSRSHKPATMAGRRTLIRSTETCDWGSAKRR
jgi:hypothetical protein